MPTIIIEVGGEGGVQWRPGVFKSRVMYRVWWLWFAVGWLRIPPREYAETSFRWVKP